MTPTHVCLGGLNPKPEVLWLEVENLVQLDSAYLAANDSTLDKPDIWFVVTEDRVARRPEVS